MKRYEHIDLVPTKAAQENARRALEVRERKPESQRGMTDVGIARARDISNGVRLSPETWRRVKAYFDRHASDKDGETWGERGKGWQAWMGWGGDENYATARRIVEQMDAADREAEARGGFELRSDWHPAALRAEDGEMQDDGTMLGRWLRVACTGRLHSRKTGDELRPLTRDELVQMAEAVNADGRDPVTWNWQHHTKTVPPALRPLMPLDTQMPWGRVVSARVEDEDGKAFLSVRTAWTEHGQRSVQAGAGALWPSVEFSNTRRDRDDGSEVGAMRLIGIAVTDSPAYAPGDVDPVVLRAEMAPPEGMTDGGDPEGASMNEEFMNRLLERLEALESRLGALESMDGPDAEQADGEDGEAERGSGYDEMRSEFAAIKSLVAEAQAKGEGEADGLRSEVASLTKQVEALNASKAEAELRSEFAEALAVGKVEARERDTYITAAKQRNAGQPEFFEAVFAGREPGALRSEGASVSTKPAKPVDHAAEQMGRAKELFRSEAGYDWNPKDPRFAADYRRLERRLMEA